MGRPPSATVSLGDRKVSVEAWGSVAVLDYACTDGDVSVQVQGQPAPVVLEGPVCPDDTIVLHDGKVELDTAADPTPSST